MGNFENFEHVLNICSYRLIHLVVVCICPPKISPSFPQDASHRPWDVPSEGTRQHFHDNSTTRCLLSVSWGHSLGTWGVFPFTHTLYSLFDPWVSTAKQNAPRGMQMADRVWQERVCVFVFWRETDCIKMLKSSFIFNGSRGLPITGTAGRLWDDLIPALLWAEVVLHSLKLFKVQCKVMYCMCLPIVCITNKNYHVCSKVMKEQLLSNYIFGHVPQ